MTRVSVITGGAGGMGLATAKVVGADHTLLLADVRQDRLDAAASELDRLGITVKAVNCDVTDRRATDALLATAAGLGTLASVIHTAGVSPSMGSADYVMRTNALGTVNVNESFFAGAAEGAAVVNVASMAAHMLPETMVPTKQFPQALTDDAAFMTDMLAACAIVGEEMQSGIAYAVSKSFVRWYSVAQCERFNGKGLRILSVSPGSFETEMGLLEADAGAGAMVADAAVPRWGRPEEMADLLAFCASDKAGYLTGTDILNDGGVIASMTERARLAADDGQDG
jgi:NAD(P)-dependent dehydrogenase (short-subunit alcohol dehydrogenase family)